jgi:hypothetical protein
MKNKITTKYYTFILGTLLAMPFYARAESPKDELADRFPTFSSKSCQIKYKLEISSVLKLVDKTKAKKKVEELHSLRKEQDENIKSIFERIEKKPENEDKKEVVEDYKDDVLKIIDERRTKIDDLQSSVQLSNKDIESIVRSTLLEQSTSTPKLCPINSSSSKEIRNTNIAKLKKLAEDKKEVYLNQTKEIQQEFLTDIKTSLNNLTEDLKK